MQTIYCVIALKAFRPLMVFVALTPTKPDRGQKQEGRKIHFFAFIRLIRTPLRFRDGAFLTLRIIPSTEPLGLCMVGFPQARFLIINLE